MSSADSARQLTVRAIVLSLILTVLLAAANAYQKFSSIVPRITRNSPTNPLVPGKPELAIANSTKKAANTGIRFTTPP